MNMLCVGFLCIGAVCLLGGLFCLSRAGFNVLVSVVVTMGVAGGAVAVCFAFFDGLGWLK